MPVTQEGVGYQVETESGDVEEFAYADEALACLEDHLVVNAPDETTMIEWDVDHEERLVGRGGLSLTLRKVFREAADADA